MCVAHWEARLGGGGKVGAVDVAVSCGFLWCQPSPVSSHCILVIVLQDRDCDAHLTEAKMEAQKS